MPKSHSASSYQQYTLRQITRYTLYSLLIFTPLAMASVQSWAVTTIHLLTLVALTAFLMEKSLTWNWKWITTPLDKPIFILIILSILSTVFSMHRYTSIWSTILLLNYIVIYYLIIHSVRTRVQFKQLIYVIIGVAAFLSILGFFKLFGANPFPWWEYRDPSTSALRMAATFFNADHLAGYMEMAIPLLLGLFLLGYRNAKIALMVCLAFFMFLAIGLSLSRGGWFGLSTGLGFMILALLANRRREKKLILLAAIYGFFIIGFIFLSHTPVVERIRTLELLDEKEESPLKLRILRWRGTIEMIKDHPLTGSGPGTYSNIFTQYQPPGFGNRSYFAHNDYLHFTAEMGLSLIAVVVWMIIALYRKGFKKLKNRSRLVRGTTAGALSGIAAILIHSFGDFNLNIPANAILFAVLAALAAGPVPLDNVSRIRLDSIINKPAFIAPQQSAIYQTE